jgi:hypothetical protein|tara:strand:- start:516 stop:929 length:414 start_codon:yes stop_codon:yes gene_type:complete
MGNEISISKIGYEDVQYAIKNGYLIINTLPLNKQSCLIKNTINYNDEERIINELINNVDSNAYIIIYGENTLDETTYDKCKKLIQFGFSNIHIYIGGLFEWLLLQDIYGFDNFPTNGREMDLLKFRTNCRINKKYLT